MDRRLLACPTAPSTLEEMETNGPAMLPLRMITHAPRRLANTNTYEHRFTLYFHESSCPISLFTEAPDLPTPPTPEGVLEHACNKIFEWRKGWRDGVVSPKGMRKQMKKLQQDVEGLLGASMPGWLTSIGLERAP